MIRWTGLAPWEFLFQVALHLPSAQVMLPKGGDAIWGQRNHPAPDFNETENTKAVLASLMVSFGGQVPPPTGWWLLK